MTRDDLHVGLRLAHPPDAEALARERTRLALVEGRGPLEQARTYWGLLGPGFLQSAMTLGGGTATASIFAGAVFGYRLLWVAPVAMLLGAIMLAAVAHQTLSTGMRPFEAMRRYGGAPIAWAWALGALLASIIWHFPHYALASALVGDVGAVLGARLPPLAGGLLVLVWAVSFSMLYSRSAAWLRIYERSLKYMVWFVILCFGTVVSRTGVSDWGALARGFLAFEIPGDRAGVVGATVVLSGLSAAVGVNQVFLYPYTLLARGWGREHRRLAFVDLGAGTFAPYLLATSLIVIATANTIHLDPGYDGTRLSPVEAAQSLAGVIGPSLGRVAFDLGVLGMVLSSITLHMLACGFVCSEVFGWEFGGRRYRLATLLPVPGVLGCVYWSEIAVWVTVPTNIACGLFLPAVYFGFIRLQRSRAYLGADRPDGARGRAWLLGMAAGTALLTSFFGWYLLTQGPAYFAGMFAARPAAAAERAAEIAVVNARVLTLDRSTPHASAVAVRDGVFVAVGDEAAVRRLVGPATRVVDAGGRAVVPGLLETHVHAVRASRGEVTQPFVQLGSIAEIQEWLRRRVREVPGDGWIRLPRADVTRIDERRMPTRAELDAAAPHRPAVFTWQYANRQLQVLNSAALRAAGIGRGTAAPGECAIRADAGGEPTGVLENCGGTALLSGFLAPPQVTRAQHLDSLERLLRRYNQLGITSIFERNTDVEGYRLYRELHAEGRLPVRVTTTLGLASDGSAEDTERVIRELGVAPGEGDEWVRVGPLKIGVDGGVLYGTAYLREPYGERAFSLYGFTDPDYRGSLRIGPGSLANLIRTGHRLGWQMVSHVTGDAGVDAVLDAVEAADADAPIRGRRTTLIHAYFPNPETARRAARLGVGVDTQPAWYYKDGDALADALGPARLERFIGLRVWLDAGVKVAINADHMQGIDPDASLNPYNPFLTLYAAVSRRTEGGRVFGTDQRVSREEALRMLTLDAAWFGFDEARKGSIEVGKLGDLAILSEDPLRCEEARLPGIRSLLTVVGGRVVYESGAPQGVSATTHTLRKRTGW